MAGDLTDPEELLAAIVRITPGLVGVDRCAVLGYDKQAREFRTLAAFGPGGTPTPFEGLRIQDAEIPRLAHRIGSLRLPALLTEPWPGPELPPFPHPPPQDHPSPLAPLPRPRRSHRCPPPPASP